MGSICGIFNFSGTKVKQSELELMTTAAAYHGRDGIGYHVDGNAGFAHLAFHTTPESAFERQPSTYLEGRYTLVADARIDNRDELLPHLFPTYVPGDYHSVPDTDVIFAAFLKWGIECAETLIGDFAFIVWDRTEQCLFAARDTMGMRPLFYLTLRNRLIIASSIDSVLSALDCPPDLNLPWIEDFVRGEKRLWFRDTVYQGVHRLPPAWVMRASQSGLNTRCYHIFGGSTPPPCTSDQEWIEAFRELYLKVVASQLRSATPVAVHLSGGLDSAAIACTAHYLRDQPRIPEVRLASMYFENTPSETESYFTELVVDYCRSFGTLQIPADQHWAFKDFDLASGFPLEEPDIYSSRSLTMALYNLGAAHGCRVALNGDMSNFVLGDMVYSSPRALRAIPISRLHHEIRYFKAQTGLGLSGVLLRAFLPESVIRAYRHFAARSRYRLEAQPPWILRTNPGNRPFKIMETEVAQYSRELSSAGSAALGPTMSAFNVTRLAFNHGLASFCGIELRIPFVDRRIVEFALRLPIHLASSMGLHRVILRESMRGIVPDPIHTKVLGGQHTELLFRGYDRESKMINQLLSQSVLQELGILDARLLVECLQHNPLHKESLKRTRLDALPVLYMENWLQRKYRAH